MLPWGKFNGGTLACFLDGGWERPFEMLTVCKIRSVPPPRKRIDKSDISFALLTSNCLLLGGIAAGARKRSLNVNNSEWKSKDPVNVKILP
jgi:hypothetical protein